MIGIIFGIFGALIGLIVGFAGSMIIGVIYTFVFVGVGCLLWFVMFKPMVERNRLLETGESAEATVIAIAENGSSMTVGGAIPKAGMTIQVEVRPKDKTPYRANLNTYVSMFELAKYQPGSIVQVKFDSKNPQKVAIAEMTQPLGNFSSK